MVKLEFTAAERDSLHYERYHHPHPRVQRKMEALWLKSQGVTHRQISRLTGISSTTLTSYLRAYQADGIEALKTVNFRRPQSELAAHQEALEAHFRQHPPASWPRCTWRSRSRWCSITPATRNVGSSRS